ncbi:penicillin acylase family protein, partial [Deinococcus pimensis]|uniref:penicillin acylase family protein n=1 Tax=Deinococcus pimensis TaxID=309888 RepID=UPI001B7F82C8
LDDDARALLPLTVEDVLSHIQRVYLVYLTQLGQRPAGEPYNDLVPYTTLLPDLPVMGTGVAGSNAWAVAGTRSASGRGLLLANPHLYWGDFHTFFEAHLNAPGVNLYGVAQVGWPVLRYGFNEQLGWAHTVNTLKGWDAFALVEREGGYVLDGEVRPFETREETLRVREADGSLREETLTVRRTVHGPVLTSDRGRAVAVRCVGLDVSPIHGIFSQYWAMGRARTHAEFEAALARGQNALFTVMYADAAGNAATYFTGLVPRRAPGTTWQEVAGTLPGDDSGLVWTETHDFSELPRVVNPPSGWVQNANNPPWLTTLPAPLDPGAYPAYVAPRMVTPREQRSLRMLLAMETATLEGLLAGANDVRSETADRLVPSLLEAARAHGDALARDAADVLERWDRRYAADSVGADLFARWLSMMRPDRELRGVTAAAWSADRPL